MNAGMSLLTEDQKLKISNLRLGLIHTCSSSVFNMLIPPFQEMDTLVTRAVQLSWPPGSLHLELYFLFKTPPYS